MASEERKGPALAIPVLILLAVLVIFLVIGMVVLG